MSTTHLRRNPTLQVVSCLLVWFTRTDTWAVRGWHKLRNITPTSTWYTRKTKHHSFATPRHTTITFNRATVAQTVHATFLYIDPTLMDILQKRNAALMAWVYATSCWPSDNPKVQTTIRLDETQARCLVEQFHTASSRGSSLEKPSRP